jgi:hypothetical protein
MGESIIVPDSGLNSARRIANTLHPWHVLGHDPQCRAIRFTQDHTTKLDVAVLNFRVDAVWWCPSLVVDLFENASADFRIRDGASGRLRQQLR